MRTFFRIYALLSSIVTAALLSSGALLGVLAWIAPEWLARPEETHPGAGREEAPAARPAPGAANPGLAAPRPISWQEDETSAESVIDAVNASLRRRLEAWESLRVPLLRAIAAAAPAAAEPLAAESDILSAAPALAARLELLARAARMESAAPLAARTVARLLMDGAAVSDAEARALLSRMDPAGAREVLERLSRAAPARAARLIREPAARPGGEGPESAAKQRKEG